MARVGNVGTTETKDGKIGEGFVIYADDGKPCLTLVYATADEAGDAKEIIEDSLLPDAIAVICAR